MYVTPPKLILPATVVTELDPAPIVASISPSASPSVKERPEVVIVPSCSATNNSSLPPSAPEDASAIVDLIEP